MSDVDSIWASLKEETANVSKEYEKRTKISKEKAGTFTMENLCFKSNEKDVKKKKKKKDKKFNENSKDKADNSAINMILGKNTNVMKSMDKTMNALAIDESVDNSKDNKVHISANTMNSQLTRDLNAMEDSDSNLRREALMHMEKTLFRKHTMSDRDYAEIFHDVCKPLFKRISDPVEKCRDLALRIIQSFFRICQDVVGVLGYFMPAMMHRLPSGLAYDEEMKVFVYDIATHEAFRRGKAVERQDRTGVASGGPSTTVIEPSEELRLQLCITLGTLLKRMVKLDALSVINPYFHDCIMFLQAQLRDPYPAVKETSCELILLMAEQDEFETGMKFFSVALCRAILPVMRHRHAKVRAVAVRALHACMIVKDRAKVKGSGTEAIMDMVGFREENVLPVASFYTSDVQINYLAEVVTDASVLVRENVADFLHSLLTEIGDRYDHQTRILPYLLDLLCDENHSVSIRALATLQKCGKQYEDEHPDEIIERRQYGVDGDERNNLGKSLPPPFEERPRLGIRLYARGNTKRFLHALTGELTNWISKTRLKSALLLRSVVVLCEEYLTMEAHKLIPCYIKALQFARQDDDKELHAVLRDTYELVGRYTAPDVYIHYVLPRLRGDKDVVQFGADSATRESVLEFLGLLLSGTKSSLLAAHFSEVITTLSDPFVIPVESTSLRAGALQTQLIMLHAIAGDRGSAGLKAATEAAFLKTGRLNMNALEDALQSIFRFLLECSGDERMKKCSWDALTLLARLEQQIYPQESPAGFDGARPLLITPIRNLFMRRGPTLMSVLLEEIRDDSDSRCSGAFNALLMKRLVTAPHNILDRGNVLEDFMLFLKEAVSVERDESDPWFLQLCSELVVHVYCKDPVPSCDLEGVQDSKGIIFVREWSENSMQCLMQHGSGIVSCFILNANYDTSGDLRMCRVNLLEALLSSGVSVKDTDLDLMGVLRVMVPMASTAQNASQLRSRALAAAFDLISLWSGNCDDKPIRLVAYSKRDKSNSMSSNEELFLQNPDWIPILLQVLDTLDDSNDTIRKQAVIGMNYIIPLIPESILTNFVQKFLTLAWLLCNDKEDNNVNIDDMDSLLRSVAVLDADLVEKEAREQLNKVKAATSDNKNKNEMENFESFRQFISDIISHCSLMQSLVKR